MDKITTNNARKILEYTYNIPKINIKTVQDFFECIDFGSEKDKTKYWIPKKDYYIERRNDILIFGITTNTARLLVSEFVGQPKVNLKAVNFYFTCISKDISHNVPKKWIIKMGYRHLVKFKLKKIK